MLTQIASHLLDLPMEKVRLVTRNTDQTTETGPAAGSRITYMVGGALVQCHRTNETGHGRSRRQELRRAQKGRQADPLYREQRTCQRVTSIRKPARGRPLIRRS